MVTSKIYLIPQQARAIRTSHMNINNIENCLSFLYEIANCVQNSVSAPIEAMRESPPSPQFCQSVSFRANYELKDVSKGFVSLRPALPPLQKRCYVPANIPIF